MKQKLGNERDDFGEGDDPEKWVEAETLLHQERNIVITRQFCQLVSDGHQCMCIANNGSHIPKIRSNE